VFIFTTLHHTIIGDTVSQVKLISSDDEFPALSYAVNLSTYSPSVFAVISVSQVLVGLNEIIQGPDILLRA
jgi:hypothetical protein